jgi:hypothetical protein
MGWFDDRRSIWESNSGSLPVAQPQVSRGATLGSLAQTPSGLHGFGGIGRLALPGGSKGTGQGVIETLGRNAVGAMQSPAAPIPGGQNTIAQGAGGDPWSQQLDAALRGGYSGAPVNEDFIRQQTDYYNQRRRSGELTGAGVPADDAYWLGRAGQAAVDDPASGLAGAGMGATGSSYGLAPGFALNSSSRLSPSDAPGVLKPWTEEFDGVDPQRISSSPAYQFRFGQGMDALQKSAAAKGTLLTGGTLKDLTAFGQGLASTEFENEYNRQLGKYQMDQGTYRANAAGIINPLQNYANSGQNAASSYAANVGNLYQQGGALNAQNTINQNAANTGLSGNLSDLVTLAGNAYNARRRRTPTTGTTTPINNPVGYDEGL